MEQGCEDEGKNVKTEVKINVKKGTARVIYLSVPAISIEAKSYALLHVISTDANKKPVGGISYLLIKQKEG